MKANEKRFLGGRRETETSCVFAPLSVLVSTVTPLMETFLASGLTSLCR